ncbi:phosphatase PAP2 family protein [Sphingomonas sp. TZW2008]|uniref:phosphatase PAP2 family protein n=1 Tax=Sphingomonas sp. TZW2008 TaxID=1917973 RepID=UPI000A269089|nr:phosphatase PAP2 family protein [Sphingomonas sp. TZW2008]
MGKANVAKKAASTEHRLVGDVAALRRMKPVALLGAASEVADQPPMVALSLVTLGSGLVMRRPAVARTGLRMLLAHALATGGKTMLKRSIDRTRPQRALRDGKHHAGTGKGGGDTDFNSFPSGHTAGAVAVAQAVAATQPQLAVTARGGAFAVAALQLPRGAHYPSDVLVGAVIGYVADQAAGALIDGAGQMLGRARPAGTTDEALAEAEAHPS